MAVGANRLLEVCDRGVSIRVDSAVRRHSWITFSPQLALDDSLGYPPRSEQQATRQEHNLAARSRSTYHDSNLLTGERTVMSHSARRPRSRCERECTLGTYP
jgi:hypothetical protein